MDGCDRDCYIRNVCPQDCANSWWSFVDWWPNALRPVAVADRRRTLREQFASDEWYPIGACIGERGTRIANILKELGNEKIDIVKYSSDPVEFIQNALSPAKDLRVFVLDEKTKETMVVVNNENLSLAIGKKGINVKLASRLTHYNLEIKTIEQVREAGINILE